MTPEQIEERAEAVLNLIESDFGQSGRDVRFMAIRDELVVAINSTKDEDSRIVLNVFGGKSHKCSENSDRYSIQDETVEICSNHIISTKIKVGFYEQKGDTPFVPTPK